MLYNPDTERAVDLAVIATQCANAVRKSAAPKVKVPDLVWDCTNGGWVVKARSL